MYIYNYIYILTKIHIKYVYKYICIWLYEFYLDMTV